MLNYKIITIFIRILTVEVIFTELPKVVAIGIYNSQNAHPDTKISKNRKTTMFEIELPVEEGGISYIDSSFMPINQNLLICAKPGQIRHTKFPFKCYFIHMILEKGELFDTLNSSPSFLGLKNHERYETIFKRLIKYYDTAIQQDEIIIQSLILELIYQISKDSQLSMPQSKVKNNNIIIEKAINYINEHLSEELTLEKVSEAVALSPIHFHNTFRTSVGKTLRDYIEDRRIKKAVNLIMMTDLSLTDIALECGFSSQSYFSYVFKRKMKTTPRKYAKEIYDKYELT